MPAANSKDNYAITLHKRTLRFAPGSKKRVVLMVDANSGTKGTFVRPSDTFLWKKYKKTWLDYACRVLGWDKKEVARV